MSQQRIYTGSSGQMLVMAELLFRQCNAAVPEVDTGTDVFAFHNDRPEVARIQVKTGQGKRYKKEPGYRAAFDIPMQQLRQRDDPRLFYALVARVEGQWEDVIVIGRRDLCGFWESPLNFGTMNSASGNLVLTVQYRLTQVICSEVDLTPFRNAWETLPPLAPESNLP